MLFKDFINEITNEKLMHQEDSVIAAVSGGADSVCLLHLLYRLREKWGFSLSCAHVHHGLREEADGDAAFVENLCKSLDVPFFLCKADVGEKAKEEKISVELAGREVRYQFFKSLAGDVIMTAHNKNDEEESILLHLIRGSGMDGLCGIPKKREDKVCRPMLRFTRAQILAYLNEHNLLWREDESNQSMEYTRNKIRHVILPKIREINPAFTDTICNMASILREENAFINEQLLKYDYVKTESDAVLFSVDVLRAMPLALRRRAVNNFVSSFSDTEAVLSLMEKESGTAFHISGGKIAEREYGFIAVYTPNEVHPAPLKLPLEGDVIFGDYKICVGHKGLALPKREYMVRAREKGDTFAPEGMTGHKKLKDYFVDEKIPRRLRDHIPIITADGEIAAVGDRRRSRNFIPKDTEVLHIQLQYIKHV